MDPWEDPSGMVALIEAQPDGRQTEWARGMGRERIKTANKIAHERAWLRPPLGGGDPSDGYRGQIIGRDPSGGIPGRESPWGDPWGKIPAGNPWG